MTEAERLIDDVERARAALIAAVGTLTDAQATFKPADGAWSIVEVVEHLYLAEISGIAKIWSGLESVRAGKRWTDPLPNKGKSIDAIIVATWKPKEAAPPIATPHIGGPMAYWVTATHSLTHVLADLGAQLRSVTLEDIVFPHFLSGPLDGRQRLEFLRYHIERHIEQVARIRATAGYPG